MEADETRTDRLGKDTESFIPRADEKALQAQIQELMCYLWDNYIQLYDSAQEIFLMGVGDAYLGVKVLLISRGMCLDPNL